MNVLTQYLRKNLKLSSHSKGKHQNTIINYGLNLFSTNFGVSTPTEAYSRSSFLSSLTSWLVLLVTFSALVSCTGLKFYESKHCFVQFVTIRADFALFSHLCFPYYFPPFQIAFLLCPLGSLSTSSLNIWFRTLHLFTGRTS